MLSDIDQILQVAEGIQEKLLASHFDAFRRCAAAAQVDGSCPQDASDKDLIRFVSSRSEPYRVDFVWINLSFVAKTRETLQVAMEKASQDAEFIQRTLTRPTPRNRVEMHADLLRTFPRPTPL